MLMLLTGQCVYTRRVHENIMSDVHLINESRCGLIPQRAVADGHADGSNTSKVTRLSLSLGKREFIVQGWDRIGRDMDAESIGCA